MRTPRSLPLAMAAVAVLVLSACRSPAPRPSGPAGAVRAPAATRPNPELIGRSRAGTPITAQTFTPAAPAAHAGPVLVIACIHGDEREGLAAIDVVLAEAASAQRVVIVVENMNPDGASAGSRGNGIGVDLNRNWPTANFRPSRAHGPAPLSEPEARAVHGLIERARPSLVVVLHSARSGPFVNFDGPASELAARFADAARRVDSRWRVVAEMGYPTPGSLGTWVGDEMGIPILTIELKRGQDVASVRQALAAGLGAVLR